MRAISRIPVINLFAGAGGLAEGFVSANAPNPFFNIALTVEKDHNTNTTLLLRNFCRQFSDGSLPATYYGFVKGAMNLDQLFSRHPKEAIKAKKITWEAELGNPDSCPPHELDSSIKEIIAGQNHWILVGGPPCQAYSKVGRSRNKGNPSYSSDTDPRFFLYHEYLRVLGKFKPSIFLMENVLGVLSAKARGINIFPKMLEDLEKPHLALKKLGVRASKIHYRLFSLKFGERTQNCDPRDFVVKTEDYGLPQTRHRVLVLGVRADLDLPISPTIQTKDPTTVGDVLAGLPPLRSGLSRSPDCLTEWLRVLSEALDSSWLHDAQHQFGAELGQYIENGVQQARSAKLGRGGDYLPVGTKKPNWMPDWYFDCRLCGVLNHSSRSHMESDLHRYLFVTAYTAVFGVSPLLDAFPINLLPAHRNALSGKFSDRFRAQPYNSQSKTITSHISQDGHYFIHPDIYQCRSFTVREAARIQGFPDNYFFLGGRTSQYIQVGNAVPPLLAKMVADRIQSIVEAN